MVEAQVAEDATLGKLYDNPQGIHSPFEIGGFSPIVTVPSTPQAASSTVPTKDLLDAASWSLEDDSPACGSKRPWPNESDDEVGGEPVKLSRKEISRTERRNEMAEIRKAKRAVEAKARNAVRDPTPDVRDNVAAKYDTPRKVRASMIQAALLIARSSDIGPNRPAETSLYDFDDLRNRPGWKYIQIDASER